MMVKNTADIDDTMMQTYTMIMHIFMLNSRYSANRMYEPVKLFRLHITLEPAVVQLSLDLAVQFTTAFSVSPLIENVALITLLLCVAMIARSLFCSMERLRWCPGGLDLHVTVPSFPEGPYCTVMTVVAFPHMLCVVRGNDKIMDTVHSTLSIVTVCSIRSQYKAALASM